MMQPDQLMQLVVDAAEEKKANRIVALGLQGISLVADYFVICHGNSRSEERRVGKECRL